MTDQAHNGVMVELQHAVQRYITTQKALIDRASEAGFDGTILVAMGAAVDQLAAALQRAAHRSPRPPTADPGE